MEGGPTIAAAFLESDRVDEVCLTLSPRCGGGLPRARGAAARALRELALGDVRVVDGFVYLRYLRPGAAAAS